MKIVEKNSRKVAVVNTMERIESAQAVLDLMASAHYHGGDDLIAIYKESLCEAFFDLKTGLAGEILQKFMNYHVRLAVIGDFSVYNSKALRDFIYECNKGNHIFFKSSLEEALEALAPTQVRNML